MSLVEKAGQRLRDKGDTKGSPRRLEVREAAVHHPSDTLRAQPRQPVVDREPLVIQMAALQRIGLIAPHAMREKIAREYQRVKRPILHHIAHESDESPRINRVMVTSAKPGEGKSFTSLNLALSLSQELDYEVVLIDGDVASPRLSRALGMGKERGLIDVLQNEDVSSDQVIRDTDVPRLTFMPSGRHSDQATELLASRRMSRLVDELAADANRIVLFDTAPLLATAESQALALHVGQIVFVVKAGHTERRALDFALSLIDQSAVKVSLLLNQARAAFGDEYAGYYGAYGQGTYGSGANGTTKF